MKVYVVLLESGTICAVYSKKSKADTAVANLEKLYENATIKECKVL
jgi:hypothetical protein